MAKRIHKKNLLGILERVLGTLGLSRKILFILMILASILVYLETIFLPYPFSLIAGVITIIMSALSMMFVNVIKRFKPIGIDEDLIYILVHMRSVITGNPPHNLLFKIIGDTEYYRKIYRKIFKKAFVLVKHWGYATPEALQIVSKESPNKALEMFLERLSAVIALGSDVSEYLRIEYNTLFSEYRTMMIRRIESLRVILGVYSTLIGAFIFMLANFVLLGLFFGGEIDIIRIGIIGIAGAELALAILLYVTIKRGRFEHDLKVKPRRIYWIKVAAASSIISSIIIIALWGRPFLSSLVLAPVLMVFIGATLLPAGILANIHESRIYEIDDFLPVFIRAYGDHLSIVPNMAEALKPILIAELGKLKELLRRAYARLVNYIDPRIVWNYFAGESGSELVRRNIHIFMDTIEYGGNPKIAGELLSDHSNELIRLRRNMLQVFRTFQTTVYLMHATSILLLTFITRLIVVFSKILQTFIVSVPPEFANLFFIVKLPESEIAFLTAAAAMIMTLANTIALMAANPGSRYTVFFHGAILMIITGIAYYLGQYFMSLLLESFLKGYQVFSTTTPGP